MVRMNPVGYHGIRQERTLLVIVDLVEFTLQGGTRIDFSVQKRFAKSYVGICNMFIRCQFPVV